MRALLNVESGLNDGLAPPVALFLAFGTADLVHGIGFVGAFVAGIACTAAVGPHAERHVFDLTEAGSELLGVGIWLVFGLVAVPRLWDATGWREVLFALLSLTVLRMVSVAWCLVRSGLQPATVLFLGWSGPRGLATVVFTLLAIESLQLDTAVRGALSAVCLTVLASVIFHGFTAGPLAIRSGRGSRGHSRSSRPKRRRSRSRVSPRPRWTRGHHRTALLEGDPRRCRPCSNPVDRPCLDILLGSRRFGRHRPCRPRAPRVYWQEQGPRSAAFGSQGRRNVR